MGFGRLNVVQKIILKQHVYGVDVIDLMCGDGDLSRLVKSLGARTVRGIDKSGNPRWYRKPGGVRFEQKALHFEGPPDGTYTALLSWPPNYMTVGVEEWLAGAEKIAYLGNNFDGTACGNLQVWNHLTRRELIGWVEDRPNTLLIYGRRLGAPRAGLHPEEKAALDSFKGKDWERYPWPTPARARTG